MTTTDLKYQISETILFHYGREIWHTRPEKTYEDTIEPFMDDLVDIVENYKSGRKFKFRPMSNRETIIAPSIPGEKLAIRLRD